MVQFNYAHYSNFVSDHIWTAPIILMIVGAVVAFICFLGCCGALKENSCMILSFAILALLIFFFEIGLGIAGYIKHTGLQQIMEVQFNNTMVHYNERKDYQDGWTLVQTEVGICLCENKSLILSGCFRFYSWIVVVLMVLKIGNQFFPIKLCLPPAVPL